MAGRNIIPRTSPRPWLIRKFAQCPSLLWLMPTKGYSDQHSGSTEIEVERAKSTAEEFERIAEEKLKDAEQGIASQTADKVHEGTEETRLSDGNPEPVEKRRETNEEEGDDKGDRR